MKREVKSPNNLAGYLALILSLLVPVAFSGGVAVGKRRPRLAAPCSDQVVAPGCISKGQLKVTMERDRKIIYREAARNAWHEAAVACTRVINKNVVVELFEPAGQIWGRFELVGLDAEKDD